jgi:hypothetical protein
MADVAVINTPANAELANRIRTDLTGANNHVYDSVQTGHEAMLVVVLSPEAVNDSGVQGAIIAALENRQHVIPVLAGNVALPRLIDHLQPLDFSEQYSGQALIDHVQQLSAPDAPRPITVLTPSVRAANRRFGLIFGGVALFVFVIGFWLIGFEGLQPGEDEFAAPDTQVFLTRNAYIDRDLPRNTDEATRFLQTYEAASTALQPYLAATATGIARGAQFAYVPRSSEEATGFPATARFIATVVREPLLQTVTAQAATAALTPTTTPTPEPEDN